MKYLSLVLAVSSFTYQFCFAAVSLHVKCNRECKCFNNESITCPPYLNVTLEYKYDHYLLYIKVVCQSPEANLLVFNGLSIVTDDKVYVQIEGCHPPSNTPLNKLLPFLGNMKNIDLLSISSCSGKVYLREVLMGSKISLIRLHSHVATNNQLEPSCFADLATLSSLFLMRNALETVPEDTFSRSTNIHTIDLSYNLISTFGETTFSDLVRLNRLDVSHNQISYLPELLFSNTTRLFFLDIRHNLLHHIEPKLFSHLNNLDVLQVAHNKIKFINGEQFSQLEKITYIDLSHNQLMSLALDPSLSDLDYSVLYNCTKLTDLLLQNNSLTEIYDDWITELTQLSRINLSYNRISDIQALNIKYFNMSTNSIWNYRAGLTGRNLSYTFGFDKKNKGLDLSNNHLNCDCDLVTSLPLVSNYFFNEKSLLHDAKCRTPNGFENVMIAYYDWTHEYERCKVLPPECPEGCKCVYRALTKSSVINCQKRSLQNYPPTLPVLPGANHTELILYGNRLREFRMPDDPGYQNVTYLNLAHNALTTLDISGVSWRLKKLYISHNNLTTLSAATVEVLRNARDLERLELHGNPWTCDLSNYQLATLISSKLNLIRRSVTCADGSPIHRIIELHLTSTRNEIVITRITVVSGVAGTLLLTLLVLVVLYFRNRQKVHVYCFSSRWKFLRWLVSHPDFVDEDKTYDAFISFSQEDETFVVEHLVPYLEQTEDRKYKLCLHYRDWIPGEQILRQIGRSVRSSRRTIVVLSPNFLRSVWGVTEFRVAHAEALKDGTARVIVILYQEVSGKDMDEELKAYLQTNTYVRWGSPWFWKQLTYALPHPRDRERGAL